MDSSLHHQSYLQDDYLSSLPLSPLGLPSFLQSGSPSASQGGAARGDFVPSAGSEVPLVLTPPLPPPLTELDGAATQPGLQPPPRPEAAPAAVMGPPAKARKRKAPTLSAAAWAPYKDRIIELHITGGLPLEEVKWIMETDGFKAEIRQYRFRISQWDCDKNVKEKEMRAIVRKRQRRTLVETKKNELTFSVRGQEVDPQKIDRFMRRYSISQSLLYSPESIAETPAAVDYRTVSHQGTPVAYSPAMAQTPAAASPALSDLSILHSTSTFVGESPAPISEPLSYLNQTRSRGSMAELSNSLQSVPQDSSTLQESLLSRYRQAEEQRLREEFLSSELLYGAGHASTLRIVLDLGRILLNQGRYRSAEMIIRKSLNAQRSGRPVDEAAILDAQSLLGEVLHEEGRYTEAEKLHRRTLNSGKLSLSSDDPSVLTCMSNLARALDSLGQYDEAEQMHRQALEMQQKVLGAEHPDTLASMNNLADVLDSRGRYSEAEQMYRQTFELRQKKKKKMYFTPVRARSAHGLPKGMRRAVDYLLSYVQYATYDAGYPEYTANQARWQLCRSCTAPVGSAV